MATLTEDTLRDYQVGTQEDYPVIAADIIFKGAAVGENGSGYARPLNAGDAFLGFAIDKADNSAGQAGGADVRVEKKGSIRLTVAGATAITTNDRVPVYASDDNTFTTTASSNSLIGFVSRWIASTDVIVDFDATLVKSHLVAAAA